MIYIDKHNAVLMGGNVHFIKPKKEGNTMRRPALVILGHTTDDIKGVREIIDVDTLKALDTIRHVTHPIDKIIENSLLTEGEVKSYNAKRPDVIYIGGTQLMRHRLQGIVDINLVHQGAWSYTNFKHRPLVELPFNKTIRRNWRKPLEVNSNPGTIEYMIYDYLCLKQGVNVTVLYGSSPVGTRLAAEWWVSLGRFTGTERIIINEVMKEDLLTPRLLYINRVG